MNEEEEIENLSENIKVLRKNQHLSQCRLAEKAGININTLMRIEQKTENPHVSTLCLIAGALNCNLEDLFRTKTISAKNIVLDKKSLCKAVANAFENVPTNIWKELIKL